MALCLSRREGEEIVITPEGGPEIRVRVLGWDRGKVRLAVQADRSVVIDRAEVHERRRRGEGGDDERPADA